MRNSIVALEPTKRIAFDPMPIDCSAVSGEDVMTVRRMTCALGDRRAHVVRSLAFLVRRCDPALWYYTCSYYPLPQR
jgi:hypothetical protein